MAIQPEGRDLLMRLMSATAMRRDVLAGNIASQNVPGYRRREVQFEEILASELHKGATAKSLESLEPEIVTDWETQTRADGNNVTPEEEASLMRENRIQFELYAMIMRGQHSMISTAINSSR